MKAYKNIERQYYKEIITSFQQPILTSNGTMGGNSFAVSGSGTAWWGFDNSDDTCLGSVGTLNFTFYNPEPLNVTKLTILNAGSTYLNFVSGGTIYASNDNSSWVTLKSFSNSQTGYTTWDVDLSSNTSRYNYYRFVSSGSFGGNSNYLGNVKITATTKKVVVGTAYDYTYYIDIPTYKLPKITERKYYKTLSTEHKWQQPTLTGNGTWGVDNMSVRTNSGTAYRYFPNSMGESTGADTHLGATSAGYVEFYTTTAICVKQINITLYHNTNPSIYGSTDGNTWVQLSDTSNYSSGVISIPSNTQFFKYHRVYSGPLTWTSTEGTYNHPGNITITAYDSLENIVEATEEDYDYYIDVPTYYGINQ